MRKTKTKTTSCPPKAILGKVSTQNWLSSTRTRPTTVVMTLERSSDGYAIQSASILKKVNQHHTVSVPADVRAISSDFAKKGLVNI
jgi:hypothetical protein